MENHISGIDRGEKDAVESMFDSVAWRYDFLNHFLSFGIDKLWRKKAIKIIGKTHKPSLILDVATGTGDLAVASMKLNPVKVTGIDISEKMLEIAREKVKRIGLSEKIELMSCDSEKISFKDNSFDVAMVAFGVRNFSDPLKGMLEMRRVIRPGGLIMILEFSKPVTFPFRQIYNFYFLNILPFFGRLISNDKKAYRYLPYSVMKFPDNEAFIQMIVKAGFVNAAQEKFTCGVVSIYTGTKP